MPVEISDGSGTPHATDYADLLDRLVTFATANGWTELENTSDKVVLQGEGAGSDEIIVAFQKYSDVPSDSYGLRLNGYTGYNDGLTFLNQPGAIQSGNSALPLWNSTIPYWFIVNTRRIIVIAKISTTYQMAYLGFYLPYATPGQYPYPLMVGGSGNDPLGATKPRWSGATGDASMFWSGVAVTTPSNTTNLNTLIPSNAWMSESNAFLTPVSGGRTFQQMQLKGMHPYMNTSLSTRWIGAADESAVLLPIELVLSNTTPLFKGFMGELDGIFYVSGNGRASEDIITVGGDDHLVVQNVFRTGVGDYCAVRLT